jgi:starch synthase
LVKTYTARRIDDKDENRAGLLQRLALEDGGPLLVMVSRLVEQKGPDILFGAIPGLIDRGFRVAVLGDGEPRYERALMSAAARLPGRVRVVTGFDEGLARQMYAGADFFVMPSRYEPCGLGQLIAQRYGTPPIVRTTGGLVDTVEDRRTGFTFEAPTSEALLHAAGNAAGTWRARGWNALRRRCMRVDHSWDGAATRYARLYELALGALDG